MTGLQNSSGRSPPEPLRLGQARKPNAAQIGGSVICGSVVYAAAMSLSPALLEILACPEDKGPLFYIEAEAILYNPRLTRTYSINDDIPVMLIDESTTVDSAEHDRLMAIVADQSIPATFVAD